MIGPSRRCGELVREAPRTTSDAGIPFSRIREIENYPLPRRANQGHWSAQPVPTQGDATRSSRNVGAGCDGRCGVRQLAAGRNARSVRRSRVVLAPRPWRLSTPARAGVSTVTKNAAHRGEHEVNRQTIARGKRTGKKYRYINAMIFQCSHLCRDPMWVLLRQETWGHMDAYRALGRIPAR